MSGRLAGYFSSLRGKITTWFVISISALMVIFSGMILFSVRLWMIQSRDTEAIRLTERVWHHIREQDSTQVFQPDKLPVSGILDTESGPNQFYLWIIGADTSVIYSSPTAISSGLTASMTFGNLTDQPRFIRLPSLGIDHRCVIYPIHYNYIKNEPVQGWIVTVADVSDVSEFINNLTKILLGMIAIGIIIALAFSVIISELALRPLSEIITTAKSITANQLGIRIPVFREDEEIKLLSQALNHLLERLQGSFDQIKQFTADASHELLTPLTIIKGELELALNKDRDAEYYKTSLANALVQTDHLIHVTQTMLKIARDEVSDESVEQEAVDLNIVISQLFRQLRYLADQKRIKLGYLVTGQLPLIKTNENLLKTLLFNLIENAIKYSPEGTTVTVRNVYKPVIGGLTIEIADEGPGIPESEKENIFSRFYRIEKSRAKVTGGSGLGLSVVSKIRQVLGLRIDIRNNKPCGTIFLISFPEETIILIPS